MDLFFSPITVAILIGLAALCVALALRPRGDGKAVEKRLTTWTGRAPVDGEALNEFHQPFVKRVIIPLGRQGVQKLGRIAPAKTVEAINERLTTAGRPGNLSGIDFLGLRVLLAAGGLALGFFYTKNPMINPRLLPFLPPFCMLLGYMMPNYWLSMRVKQRKDAIQRSLPDALDMLTICVEAGLAFESALQRVGEQWRGPLSDEFSRAVAEIRLGVARPQALRRMSARCGVADVSSFVAVLVQADSMGTSISHVLHSQGDQIRTLRRQRAEEMANKAPIKMLIPMGLLIFPALFITILGPAVPRILDAFVIQGAGR